MKDARKRALNIKSNEHSTASVLFNSLSPPPNDPFFYHKKFTIPMHPLWNHLIGLFWEALKRRDGEMESLSYTQYKDLRLAVSKSLSPEFSYDETVQQVHQEWKQVNSKEFEGIKEHSKLSSFIELSMSKGKITLHAMGSLLSQVFHTIFGSCSLNSYLFLLACLYLNATSERKMKIWDDIELLPSNYKDFLQREEGKQSFQVWYTDNFISNNDIILQIEGFLREVFPNDKRIRELWRSLDYPSQSEVLIKCISRLDDCFNHPRKPNKSVMAKIETREQTPQRARMKDTKRKSVDHAYKVRLPIFGQACTRYSAKQVKETVNRVQSKSTAPPNVNSGVNDYCVTPNAKLNRHLKLSFKGDVQKFHQTGKKFKQTFVYLNGPLKITRKK